MILFIRLKMILFIRERKRTGMSSDQDAKAGKLRASRDKKMTEDEILQWQVKYEVLMKENAEMKL